MTKDALDSMSFYEKENQNMANDPIEELFALNMGDFIAENLISDDLLVKISSSDKNTKLSKMKNQLKELISIYSLDNTLNILGFSDGEEFVIYNAIAKTVRQMLDLDACHILLADENHQELKLSGSSLKNTNNFKISLKDKNVLTQSFINDEIVYLENVENVDNFKPYEKLGQKETKTFLAVPISNYNEKKGLILLESYEQKEILEEFISLISVTSKLFVTSLKIQQLVEDTQALVDDENANIPELTSQRTELTAIIGDLGDLQQSFVESLAASVDAKGHYKKEHCQKVANLAVTICNYLELNEKTTDLIYYAGLLQNIGKITLPEELFTKKGQLSTEEWERLENHPNIGVSLLMNINFLSEVIPYINYHRERWDGRGEPEGLAGQSIPLGSRIIAVADAYMAMVADRPYRDAIAKDKALEILKKEAGIKWDPIIIDALDYVVNYK